MATLRQVTDDGKNPRLGLETAKQVLPQIENEEKFTEARSELRRFCPTLPTASPRRPARPRTRPKRANWSNWPARRWRWSTIRRICRPRCARTAKATSAGSSISCKAAERGIQQDKDLATAVEKISAAAEKGTRPPPINCKPICCEPIRAWRRIRSSWRPCARSAKKSGSS